MSKLRSRMRVLMAEKSLREKRRITLATVVDETQLARPTIVKMAGDEVAQIKGETVVIICKYFGCSVGDLLYIEE